MFGRVQADVNRTRPNLVEHGPHHGRRRCAAAQGRRHSAVVGEVLVPLAVVLGVGRAIQGAPRGASEMERGPRLGANPFWRKVGSPNAAQVQDITRPLSLPPPFPRRALHCGFASSSSSPPHPPPLLEHLHGNLLHGQQRSSSPSSSSSRSYCGPYGANPRATLLVGGGRRSCSTSATEIAPPGARRPLTPRSGSVASCPRPGAAPRWRRCGFGVHEWAGGHATQLNTLDVLVIDLGYTRKPRLGKYCQRCTCAQPDAPPEAKRELRRIARRERRKWQAQLSEWWLSNRQAQATPCARMETTIRTGATRGDTWQMSAELRADCQRKHGPIDSADGDLERTPHLGERILF